MFADFGERFTTTTVGSSAANAQMLDEDHAC